MRLFFLGSIVLPPAILPIFLPVLLLPGCIDLGLFLRLPSPVFTASTAFSTFAILALPLVLLATVLPILTSFGATLGGYPLAAVILCTPFRTLAFSASFGVPLLVSAFFDLLVAFFGFLA